MNDVLTPEERAAHDEAVAATMNTTDTNERIGHKSGFWNCPECGGTEVKEYPEDTYRGLNSIMFKRGCKEPTCDAIWTETSLLTPRQITVIAEGRSGSSGGQVMTETDEREESK